MKTTNKVKYKKINKLAVIIISGLLILTSYIALTSMYQPIHNETTPKNIIHQETEFFYMAKVLPSELYPEGGLIEPGTVIFEKVTEIIPTTIKTTIYAEENIEGTGTFQPILKISAGDYWEREISLDEKQSFQFTGVENQIINQTFDVDIERIKGLISSIEEEISVFPNSYQLIVNPNINGTITYDGSEIEIKNDGQLIFEYSSNQIELISEEEYLVDYPIGIQQSASNAYSLFSLSLPLTQVKWVSTILSIVFLLILLYMLLKGKTTIQSNLSEVEKIERKYQNRIINVSHKMDIVNKSTLILVSFEDLLQVSDEKELPIYRYQYQNKTKNVYFIIDQDYIIKIEVDNRMDNRKNVLGSEVSYG